MSTMDQVDAVRAQLAAMAASTFRLQLRQWRLDGTEVALPTEAVTAQEILRRLPELGRRNAARADVWVANLDAEVATVLVDDLDRAKLSVVFSEIQPRAVIETSENCFQAWIAVPHEADQLQFSRGLCRRYEGDRGAVGAHQNGRLAGFTNQKPRRRDQKGRGFWIRLHCCDLNAPPPAGELARAILEQGVLGSAPQRALLTRIRPSEGHGTGGPDLSRQDWARVCRELAGGTDPEVVRRRLVESTWARTEKPKRDPELYAEITVREAVAYLRRKCVLPGR